MRKGGRSSRPPSKARGCASADRDDVAGLHPRRDAARHRRRRRRGEPAVDRHRRHRRHAAATFVATFFVPLFFRWIAAGMRRSRVL
jgi:hypothetical protein